MSRAQRAVARRGFTLIEVMVALGIVAIALVAGLKATQAVTGNAERQSDMVLAQICAENELARIRLSSNMPPVGDTPMPCEQAGRAYEVMLTVRPTPNPNFHRVDAQVRKGEYGLLRFSTVVGRH